MFVIGYEKPGLLGKCVPKPGLGNEVKYQQSIKRIILPLETICKIVLP